MKALRVCSILATLATIHAIAQDISEVRFTYRASLGEPPQEILVVVGTDADSASAYVFHEPTRRKREGGPYKADAIVPLSRKTFQEIIQAVAAITLEDLRRGMAASGEDGSTWTLESGHGSNTISFQVWTAGFKTQERHLGPFMHACRLIQKHARLDHLVFD